MFTGIVESLGSLSKMEREGSNLHFTFQSDISDQLKIDQSIAHNGVCLTVVRQEAGTHTVTAVAETLQRSNLDLLQPGDLINLERAMMANMRLDGHMVQGHVDAQAECVAIETLEGSWYFTFRYPSESRHLLVDKGSICVNGVSLTVVAPVDDLFSVAIIPFTFEHTNFKNLAVGDMANLEYDIIGKYFARYAKLYLQSPPGISASL